VTRKIKQLEVEGMFLSAPQLAMPIGVRRHRNRLHRLKTRKIVNRTFHNDVEVQLGRSGNILDNDFVLSTLRALDAGNS